METPKKPKKTRKPYAPKACGHCKKPLTRGKCTNCGPDCMLTPALSEAIIDLLKLDLPVQKLCDAVGISKGSFYRWVREIPDFAKQVRAAKYFATNLARKSVIKHMMADGNLALKYLERKEKDEFSTRSVVKNEPPSQELDQQEREELRKLFEVNGIVVPGFDENGDFEQELG